MIWTLYSLAKNPDVQENLYHEVSTVLGPKEIATPETLRKMHYLKACVKESLRFVDHHHGVVVDVNSIVYM